MDNVFFNFSHPLLRKLNDGATIKLGFKIFFWVMAGLNLLFGLYSFYQGVSNGFHFGVFIASLGLLFASWISFQICLFRATSVSQVPDSRYVVSAIFAILLRGIGEIMATYFTVAGVTAALIPAGGYNEFGFLSLVLGPVVGFLAITFFYFLAERLSALPEIAVNTKKD
jgi:hypothetical protein